MSVIKQLIIVAVLAVLGAGVWFGLEWRDSSAANGPASEGQARRGGGPAPVVLAPVTTRASGTQIRAVGTAEAAQAAVLHPEASGTVVEVLYEPGDRVERGAVLVRLDDEEARLAVELARSELADAERDLARIQKLRASGTVPETQLDQARSAVVSARNRLAAAELAQAKRSVRAPFAGVVGLKMTSVGETVTTSTPVATLDDRTSLLVAFELPERYAGLVREGHPVSATTPSFPGERLAGQISSIDSRIDPVTRTLRVEARIPNTDDRLRPGMSFAVTAAFEGTPGPAVPELAIQWDNKGSFVWAVRENEARRVPVTIRERREGFVVVEGALEPDEHVVVEGVQRMREGAPVAPPGDPAPQSS